MRTDIQLSVRGLWGDGGGLDQDDSSGRGMQSIFSRIWIYFE